MHISTGQLVITQEEMLKCVFAPLANDLAIHERYLIPGLVEYLRSLHDLNIPIATPVQLFAIQLLIKAKATSYMQMLMQYQSFSDSLELAKEFEYLGKHGCDTALQWAIDMYHRLKQYNEVIKILMDHQKVMEMLVYIEQNRVKDVLVKDVLKVVNDLPVKRRKVYTDYFIKARVSI